jgi:hypothetical protein
VGIRGRSGAFVALALLAGCATDAGGPAAAGPPPHDPASATATLVIRATARGKLPVMRPIRFDAEAECAALNPVPVPEQTIVEKDGRLTNVIAWVSKGWEAWTYAPAMDEATLEMRACMFVPHVLTLRAGQPLRVGNPDHGTLHFHAVPANGGEIAREVAKGGSFLASFTSEEVGLRIKCDIHNWMQCYAGVFSHPFHGVTGADGTVSIKVPPGEYEVSAWHEYAKFAKPAPQSVKVAAGETKEIEFVYETTK